MRNILPLFAVAVALATPAEAVAKAESMALNTA